MSQRRSALNSDQAETSTNSKVKQQNNINSIIATRASRNKQTGDIYSKNKPSIATKSKHNHIGVDSKAENPIKGITKNIYILLSIFIPSMVLIIVA